MAKAPASDQRRLLEVQELDKQLQQLAHKRRSLPGIDQLAELDKQLAAADGDVATARADVGDVRRELTKAEADVEQVEAREKRDRDHLDSGQGTAKDLQGLQSELETLARRRAELEDVQLGIMERLEAAERTLGEREDHAGRLHTERDQAAEALEGALSEIDLETKRLQTLRVDAVANIDAGLLALYDKLREQSGGVGAAALQGGRCMGCRLEIAASDLTKIRAAAEDDIVRCEECGRILVREDH